MADTPRKRRERTPEQIEADRQAKEWYDQKSKLLEESLGKAHNMVMHAIIPFAIGGGLDLYYYPNGIPGTAIATKELSNMPDEGSSNRSFSTYELVMFTRHPLDLNQAKDPQTPFGKQHGTLNAILNRIARYSAKASLNSNETCEFPAEMKTVGGKCLIFDSFAVHEIEGKTFGLLLIIDIFRSEMDFARKNGGKALVELLKKAGHYPYSDLDREPVA